MESCEWLPSNMVVPQGRDPSLLCCIARQDDFDGISTVLVYPGSPMATDLDNNLWLPHIVTYNSAQMDALSYEVSDPPDQYLRLAATHRIQI